MTDRKPVADISIVIPVVRRSFINVVLRAFELGSVMPVEVVLVSNEIERSDLCRRDFPVRLIKFKSKRYVVGFHDVALRRNIGAWQAKSSYVLCFDDDEIPMPDVVSLMEQKLRKDPFIWGHHRFTDFDQPQSNQDAEWLIAGLQSALAESGRSREAGVNANHLYLSGYGGLFACARELLISVGGFDMIHNGGHGEDQALARQMSHYTGGGDGIFIHEPPFAWCSNKYFPFPPLETNICKEAHEFRVQTLGGVTVHRCIKCPYMNVPNLHPSPSIRMPFDSSEPELFEVPDPFLG